MIKHYLNGIKEIMNTGGGKYKRVNLIHYKDRLPQTKSFVAHSTNKTPPVHLNVVKTPARNRKYIENR